MKPGMSPMRHYLHSGPARRGSTPYLFDRAASIKRRFKNYGIYQPLRTAPWP